jgi:hypothetical protein
VTVDEPGNGQFSPAVDDLISVFVHQAPADLRDPAIHNENISTMQQLSGLENGDVSYQHQGKLVRRDIKIVERRFVEPMVSSGLRSPRLKSCPGVLR